MPSPLPSALMAAIILVFSLPFCCNGQETVYDSLLTRYHNESLPDTSRISALLLLGETNFLANNADSLLNYLREVGPMIKEAASTDDSLKWMYQIGTAYFYADKYLESIKQLKLAENKAREARDTHILIRILHQRFNALGALGDYPAGVETLLTNLKLAEQTGYEVAVSRIKGALGTTFVNYGEYEKARTYLLESLAYNEAKNDTLSMVVTLSNIGLSYREEKKWDQSLEYELRAYELVKAILPWKYASTLLMNIGTSYLNGENRDSAQVYFYRGLAMAEQQHHLPAIVQGAIQMAYFYQVSQPDSAIYYGEKALALAKGLHNKTQIKNASEILYQLYEDKGQYREALTIHKLWRNMVDSIFSEENQRSVFKAEAKYEYEKQQLKDQVEYEQALTRTKLKSQARFYLLSGSFILILIGIGVAFQIRKNRRDRERDKLLYEMALLKERVSLTSISVDGIREELQLDREKIEAFLGTKLGESSWKILNAIFEDPTIGNREIGEKVFLSVEGVSSSLRRMYKNFDVNSESSQNLKVALVAKAVEISLG